MAWTEITRAQYQRGGLRYASDTTDAEWALNRRSSNVPERVSTNPANTLRTRSASAASP